MAEPYGQRHHIRSIYVNDGAFILYSHIMPDCGRRDDLVYIWVEKLAT